MADSRLRSLAVASLVAIGCGPGGPSPPSLAGVARADSFFLEIAGRPTVDRETGLVITHPGRRYVSLYDNALTALLLTGRNHRLEAARILVAVAKLQSEDGSIPFSFRLTGDASRDPYIRTGALAWAGYAAVVFLDADKDGKDRETIARFAHEAAKYVLDRQVAKPGDPRDGLVRGGFGVHRYEVRGEAVEQVFHAEPIEWISIEHNIDAYFFLRELGRVTASARYSESARRIAAALSGLWLGKSGQLPRGVSEEGADTMLALDCASWASVFFASSGDRARAETAFAVADARYRSKDKGALGHKPYAHAPIYENRRVAEVMRKKLGATEWDELPVVWPEGSAGVALAALRVGDKERAAAILSALEPLRLGGALPTLSREIPLEFDMEPSIAGTLWVELVRDELTTGRKILFAP